MDCLFYDFEGKKYTFLNTLCWGTNKQVVIRVKTAEEGHPTALECRSAFMHGWVRPFGWPEMVVLDQGPEFLGSDFGEWVNQWGVLPHYTDGNSPWQNGRTERAGQDFKDKLSMLIQEATIVGKHEFLMAASEICAARSRIIDKSGYSIDQRVFGRNLRLPLSLLSTDAIDRIALMASADDEVDRSREIRDKAMEAWVRHLDRKALCKASHALLRSNNNKTFQPGQWVKVWRQGQLKHGTRSGWVGPGVYLCPAPKGSLWISMRGGLWKCSPEQVRECSDSEHLGAEIALMASEDLFQKIGKWFK